MIKEVGQAFEEATRKNVKAVIVRLSEVEQKMLKLEERLQRLEEENVQLRKLLDQANTKIVICQSRLRTQ